MFRLHPPSQIHQPSQLLALESSDAAAATTIGALWEIELAGAPKGKRSLD